MNSRPRVNSNDTTLQIKKRTYARWKPSNGGSSATFSYDILRAKQAWMIYTCPCTAGRASLSRGRTCSTFCTRRGTPILVASIPVDFDLGSINFPAARSNWRCRQLIQLDVCAGFHTHVRYECLTLSLTLSRRFSTPLTGSLVDLSCGRGRHVL